MSRTYGVITKKEYSVGETTGVFYASILKSFIQSGNTDMVGARGVYEA